MRNSKNLPDELPTPHRNFCRVACLCYRFDASFAVSRLLPLTQTPDLSSCLTQCGVCSWTRPDLRNKRVPSKHIYMDTCLYIMCVSVLCRERTTMFLDTKANARTQTHWAIPDRLVNALCNTSIENYQVLFSVDFCRSVKMQLRRTPPHPPPPNPWTNRKCTTVDRDPVWQPLSGWSRASRRAYRVSSPCSPHTQRSWPQIFTPPGRIGNCNQFLFLFFTQDITLMI